MDSVSNALRNGELVCLFPEGTLTKDGKMLPFRPGIEKILARDPVPVIPCALQGLWGSYFSHKEGRAMSGIPKKIFFPIAMKIGPAIAPEKVSVGLLEEKVKNLRGNWK